MARVLSTFPSSGSRTVKPAPPAPIALACKAAWAAATQTHAGPSAVLTTLTLYLRGESVRMGPSHPPRGQI